MFSCERLILISDNKKDLLFNFDNFKLISRDMGYFKYSASFMLITWSSLIEINHSTQFKNKT